MLPKIQWKKKTIFSCYNALINKTVFMHYLQKNMFQII